MWTKRGVPGMNPIICTKIPSQNYLVNVSLESDE